MSALPTWRDEDEVYLAGLADRRAMAIVAARLGVEVPARASGTIAALRETETGGRALDAAERTNDYTAVATLLGSAEIDLTPRLAHHLALHIG